jgi:hypothetical protein
MTNPAHGAGARKSEKRRLVEASPREGGSVSRGNLKRVAEASIQLLRRMSGKGVDLRRSSLVGTVSTRRLAQVPPADLDIPVLGQLAAAQLPLSDAIEPGSLEVVGLDAAFGGGRLREQALEYAPRDPTRPRMRAGRSYHAGQGQTYLPNGWGVTHPGLCCS